MCNNEKGRRIVYKYDLLLLQNFPKNLFKVNGVKISGNIF